MRLSFLGSRLGRLLDRINAPRTFDVTVRTERIQHILEPAHRWWRVVSQAPRTQQLLDQLKPEQLARIFERIRPLIERAITRADVVERSIRGPNVVDVTTRIRGDTVILRFFENTKDSVLELSNAFVKTQ